MFEIFKSIVDIFQYIKEYNVNVEKCLVVEEILKLNIDLELFLGVSKITIRGEVMNEYIA